MNRLEEFCEAPEGKGQVRTIWRRWEYIIETDLTEIGWEDTGWINLAQGGENWQTVINTVMNLQIL